MKKKNSPSSTNILQTDVSGLLWRWLKGVWSGFNRWIKRSLNPSTGKRPTGSISPKVSQHRKIPLHVSPLVGVPSHNIEAMTVGNLFATVRWNVPTQTSTPATVTSVKDQISWD